MITESSKMLEALNLTEINGFSSPWRDNNPFAVARAMLNRVDHDNTTRISKTYDT